MAPDLMDIKRPVLQFKMVDGDWVDLGKTFNYIDDYMDHKHYFIENEEEIEMNQVLHLWYQRKRNKIIEKYDELETNYNTTKYGVIESFNELVDSFNRDLEDLYRLDKATEQFVLKENAPNNVIKYCIDYDKINEEFKKEYNEVRSEELRKLEDLRNEVEAQLSLSNDLEYQQEVLERYEIINKKTKKISE